MTKQKFIIEKNYSKNTKNGSMNSLKITKSNTNKIKTTDVEKLFKTLHNKYGSSSRLMIRGLGPTRWSTLANFNEGLIIDEYEEYFQGKVSNSDTFDNFSELEVIILK
jgi:hypothetical protein